MYRFILAILISLFTLISSVALADKITASIQRDLNRLGYNAGPVDGVAGRKTISSLEAFYNDYGGEFDGAISAENANKIRGYAKRYSSNYSTENGLVRNTAKNPYSHRFVYNEARAGSLSQRMEVRSGDCAVDWVSGRAPDCRSDRERAEVIFANWKPGRSTWMNISVKIDNSTKPDPFHTWQATGLCTSIVQLKVFDDGVDQSKYQGNDSFIGGAPVFFIRICGEQIMAHVVKTDGDSKYGGDAITLNYSLGTVKQFKDDWVDLIIHFDDTGYRKRETALKIFVDNKLKVDVQNFRKFFPDVYALKYGFYRSHVSERLADYGNRKKASTLIAYFDEVRVGSTMEEVMPTEDNPVD